MKKFSSKVLSVLAAIAIVVPCILTSDLVVQAAGNSTTVTIFHTNDMHGEIENLSYVKALKDVTENSILVDAGDSTQGTALTTYSDGAAAISLMNYAGYDGMTLGNHEFDYGVETTLINAQYAKFPVVAANVYNKEGDLLLAGVNGNNGQNFIVEKAGKKIGFFGISTQETAYKSDPTGLDGTIFADVIATSQAQADYLKAAGCDAVVALAHVGVDESSNPTSEMLAKSVSGIDVIIDGHSHTEYEDKINGITIAQTGTKLANIGKVQITFKANGTKSIKNELLNKETYKAVVVPDATCASVYGLYTDMMKPILDTVIGSTTEGLIAYAGDGQRVCRLEETVMGDIVADSMLAYGKKLVAESPVGGKNIPVVAMQNGGGVRANIDAGDITYGEVINVLPYNNTLGARMVTPHQLYATLENGVCTLTMDEKGVLGGLDGRYPQVSGMRLVVNVAGQAYDPENPAAGEGSRIAAIYLTNADGTETLLNRADDITKLALVSNSFEISGGDGYIMLSDLPFVAESAKLDCDVLADYLRDISVGGAFTFGATQGRVTVIQQSTAAFHAVLPVSAEGFAIGTNVQVSIDGTEYKSNVVGADGNLVTEELTAGAHTIDVRLDEISGPISYFASNISGINVK